MPRRTLDEDEWDDDPDDDNPDDDEDDSTGPCPYCGAQIPEDVSRCPYCENYISEEDSPPARKPLWIIIGTLLCLYIVYRWIAG